MAAEGFLEGNVEHLLEADRAWQYTMGKQVPESFIMSQLLGLLLPSAKNNGARMMSLAKRCRLFEALVQVKRGEWSRFCGGR